MTESVAPPKAEASAERKGAGLPSPSKPKVEASSPEAAESELEASPLPAEEEPFPQTPPEPEPEPEAVPERLSPPKIRLGKKPLILLNIPSRRLRFYKDGALALDIPMAIGRIKYWGASGNSRTRIGSYRITSWHQNYRSRDYPHSWGKDSWRGAFGAFTAKLGPRASYQYIHGTLGPKSLGDWLIRKSEDAPVGEGESYLDHARRLRWRDFGLSHGCVRVANDRIERLFHEAPVGTRVEKFYCLREKVRDEDGKWVELNHPNVYRYQDVAWDSVFTPETAKLEGYHHPVDAKGPR